MDGNSQGQKLLRAPNLKRGRQDERITDRVKLEKVFGVTLNSRSALACDPNTGVIAYPAGCTVVLYHSASRHQSHIINASRKSITTLAFSSCGRYIVTGETGHHPAVRVWDLLPDPQVPSVSGQYPKPPQQIAEFFGHKFGVGCVAFSPTNKIIVSVGSQHDMIVNVWDWRNNIKVASNKVSTKVKSIAFAENGSYFVTVGNRLVKFWYLDAGRNKYKQEAVPLMGRSAILGEQRNNNFVDVACGRAECGDNTYAITRSGLLCEFNNRRLLDKWVELRTSSANSISVGEKHIFVGCDGGIVRCFDPKTLQFVTTLPRAHYLGVDVSQGLNITHMSSPPPNVKYPDVIALTYDEKKHLVTCVYNDHSIYIWDVWNIYEVGKTDSFLFHSGCIWGVEMAPANCPLPPGSFLTCSSDDTIRVWTLDRFDERSFKGMYVRNIYSKEVLKVLYTDPELTYLKDRGSTQQDSKENASYDTVNGVRSIRLSPDGRQLASGDRTGNIRIHETTNMSEVMMIEAHDAEVLCLEFSGKDAAGHRLMASASRDRLIHVFDVNKDFNFLQTLDDHSSSITSVRFLNSQHGNLQMISCGADKSLIFRSLAGTPNGTPQFQRSHNATGKNTLYDMEIDAGEKHVLTACQDRNVRVYNVVSGKHTKTFKGCIGDEGCLIKVVLDKSGSYLATSSTDKSLCVYDYYTGECMATMSGHSELGTGLCFTNDCKRIISTSGDGCIFVWKLPHDMVVSMHARYNQQVMLSGKKPTDEELFSEIESDDDLMNTTIIREMSFGKLPTWAKKHMKKNFKPAEEPVEKNIVQPKGRWAERAANNDLGKNVCYFSDVDSSLESDRDLSQKAMDVSTVSIVNTVQNETTETNIAEADATSTPLSTENDLETAAHDADVDSDHDYRQQPLYYPNADSASGSEFTVNNIDVDELRKSVRRSKRASLPPLALQTAAANPTSLSTGTGSQESDDDDDDDQASTPSGENTDANPMSMISTSMESLYQREKYLAATYESLSANEMESPRINKSSISNQHNTRRSLGLRNVAVVNAAKQTKNDVETTKKRELLNKMIADTKKKLQCIGYVSPLKASQSISDLSHFPEKESRKDRHRSTGNDFTHASSTVPTCDPTLTVTSTNISSHPSNQLSRNTNEINLCYDAEQPLPASQSVPNDLQLCGCYMREIQRNLSHDQSTLRNINIPLSSNSAHAQSTRLSDILSKSPEKHEQNLAAWIEPRRQQLDKTLNKKYKSLPVSPVSEEKFDFDFTNEPDTTSLNVKPKKVSKKRKEARKSFSYFLDIDSNAKLAGDPQNEYNFKQICDDIEKFSQDFSRNYQAIEDIFNSGSSNRPKELFVNSGSGFQTLETLGNTLSNEAKTSEWITSQFGDFSGNNQGDNNEDHENGNFSSDSLEECSFNSFKPCRKVHKNKLEPPRRCVSNNELYNLTQKDEIDYDKYLNIQMSKSHSQGHQGFYLNQSAFNSQESILSSEENLLERRSKSFCNSMESILSNESDCKSAPLECLFRDSRTNSMTRSKSCNYTLEVPVHILSSPTKSKTVQTQTDFETPEELVVKKSKSTEFQQRLLRFEQKKPVAYFLETKKNLKHVEGQEVKEQMDIPSMQFKNAQYKSKYCNVLNNKPECNEKQLMGNPQFALTTQNLPMNNKNKNKCQGTASLDRHLLSKGLLESSEKICHKPPKAVRRHSSKTRRRSSATRTTYEYVKKEDLNKVNLENSPPTTTTTSIEFSYKEMNTEKDLEDTAHAQHSQAHNLETLQTNITKSLSPSALNDIYDSNFKEVQLAFMNIKILNEIQEKITGINNLIELFKTSLVMGKVKALSSMYDNLSKASFVQPPKRNMSMPDFFDMKFYQCDRKNFNFDAGPDAERDKFYKDEFNEFSRSTGKNNTERFLEFCDDCDGTDDDDQVQRSSSNAKDVAAFVDARMSAHMDSASLGGGGGSMRRACSLSDLSHLPSTPPHHSSSGSSSSRQEGKYVKNPQLSRLLKSRDGGERNDRTSNMMRSSSTTVLNPSDSDDGGSSMRTSSGISDKLASQSRLMRPTISSQNKIANSKSSLRKRHSHSTLNLSSITREDSSSEESEMPPPPPPPTQKPVVPPRTRVPSSLQNDGKNFNNLREKLKTDNAVINMNSNGNVANRAKWSKPDVSNEVSTVQESRKLCTDVARNLVSTASDVVKLYDNLTNTSSANKENAVVVPADGEERTEMVKTLQLSIVTTQKLLHDLTLQILRQDRGSVDVNQTDSVKKLNDLILKGFPTDESAIVNIMQQYSDILLGMMQQKIEDSNK